MNACLERALRWATPAFLVLGASACASSGTAVGADQVSKFHTGQTTESEVVAELGPPNLTSTSADGTKIDTYVHSAHSVNAANFIPVVGLLAGGVSSSSNSVSFKFDSKGILVSTSSQASNADISTGLLNQR